MNTPRRVVIASVLAAAPVVSFFEGGFYNKAFLDPVGIPTICFGHTEGVKLGQAKTDSECMALFMDDLNAASSAVERCVKPALPEKTRTAFVSFTYNVGAEAFCGSTAARMLNAGDFYAACNQLDRWVYAKGIELPGLVNRRGEEKKLCLEGLKEKS